MLEPQDLLLIVLGLLVGGFGTLVGAGGGFILVPVLLLLYPGREPETVTAVSLLVVCLNAASGSAAFAHQKRIDYFSGAWFAAGTFPGAIAGALVVGFIPRQLFDAIFAAVLGIVGVWLLLGPDVNAIHPPVTGRGVAVRDVTDRSGLRFIYAYHLWKGVAISTGVGFLSSLLGIGGGIIHVPVMVTVLHFPVHVATATSQFVLLFMSAEGSAVHAARGTLEWGRPLVEAGLLGIGAVAGAQVGARFAQRVRGRVIVLSLAVALLLAAARLALKAAGI